MNRLWDNPWVNRLLALFLAIGLFAYVNVESINNTRQNANDDTTLVANKTQTVKVPLQVNANTDKYFITGYPSKVSVALTGTASLVTMTANTQNFRVVADLTNLGVGKHRVHLKAEGLNKDLSYSISPKSVTVDIQVRENKTMPIQVRYNKASIASGYAAGDPKLSARTVEVTGARSVIDSIAQVVANVSLPHNTRKTVDQEVLLQALDDNGNTMNVVLSPQTVHVTLPISRPSKKINVELKQTGNAANGYTYALSSDTKQVTVYADQQSLDKLSKLTIPVDVSGITSTTTRTFNVTDLNDSISAADPKTIKVTVSVGNTGTGHGNDDVGTNVNAGTSTAASSASSASSSQSSSSSENTSTSEK
ncbi:hypothetical protein BVJ53_12370 [Lacticaseibacillus chiayiensis]|uniref:CdaR family protein n=1 Tax=Lacticaseibacillus chiayiensis TaxID=2100821 RepID=A0A4V1P022_9LACO|nr:CdaR family protein [Lacticaseibacillus chiayiensis]QVI35515.1 hypothetical protein KG086_04235 [Lacticaseibacillus chiayiensis]RXT19010.1 hypothetical protein BVJ53_12370 [Lacticaseibacillus chiayiensis]UYN57354.1 CdaR family protein [Lacticaseibacillus chiayiensis]